MRKGFTLVELIGVIVLLGVIALIAYPTITNTIEKSKDKAYEQQIRQIEQAASRWGLDNEHLLNTIHSVDLPTLIKDGYIQKPENGKVINPKTNEEMKGCVLIEYSNEYNQYLYTYDSECKIPYKDSSGASYPELANKMIPLK